METRLGYLVKGFELLHIAKGPLRRPGNENDRKDHKIRILDYKDSDLKMAVSDELRGLVVHGRSHEEIAELLPGAVRELLEAEGFRVIRLTVASEHESPVPDISPPTFIASASLTGGLTHHGVS